AVSELLTSRAPLPYVFLDDLLPLALGLQNELNHVPQRAVSAAVLRDVVSVTFHFVTCIGYGNRKPTIPHHRQVDYVVADEAGLSRAYLLLFQNAFKHAQLVVNSL